jgi:hypothetical protein
LRFLRTLRTFAHFAVVFDSRLLLWCDCGDGDYFTWWTLHDLNLNANPDAQPETGKHETITN